MKLVLYNLGDVNWDSSSMFELRDLEPQHLAVVANHIAAADYAGGRSAADIHAILTVGSSILGDHENVRDLYGVTRDSARTLYENMKMTKMMYDTGIIEPTFKYHSQKDYFQKPTEMFARSFRQYFAMKDGLPEWTEDTLQDWDRDLMNERKKQNDSIHGLPFPDVDPTYEMVQNGFEGLLRKYFGEHVKKSLPTVVELVQEILSDKL